MGNLSNYVTVTISRASAGLTRAGFGTLLILTPNTSGWGAARTRTYLNMASVEDDWAADTFEWRAANAAFAQNPAPKKIKMGRLALAPTLVYTIVVNAVRSSYTYQMYVTTPAVDRTLVEFTSDSSATNDEICTGIVAALEAVVGTNFVAAVVPGTGDTDTMTVTADAAGGWFALEVANPADLGVAMTHADPGYATDLAAIKLADTDFYAIYNGFNSNAVATAIATWTETAKKFFMMDSNETRGITTAATSSDTFDDLKTAARDRTATFYHHRPDQMAGAALCGKVLPVTPGSETWADKPLSGVDPTELTDTHRSNLESKNANGYEAVGSAGLTFFGKTASGEWIDKIRFLDWFENTAATRIFNVKRASDKIPMTNPGIAKIEAELRATCKEGERAGGIKPGWTVVTPDADDPDQVTDNDRTTRTLNNVFANIQLQGAIHIVNVRANVVD